jgi:hypothetical protein
MFGRIEDIFDDLARDRRGAADEELRPRLLRKMICALLSMTGKSCVTSFMGEPGRRAMVRPVGRRPNSSRAVVPILSV